MYQDYQTLKNCDQYTVRKAVRSGQYASHTAGLCKGFLQVNLVILAEQYALDFMRFCQRNPKPCPLVGVSDTGNPMMMTLGHDIDIRHDVPAFNIYREGTLECSVTDISELWADDFVAFGLGCSFTFEHALLQAGIGLWHISNNKTVPMFRSNIDTVPAGPFSGKMVVSMRMIPTDKLAQAIDISRRYPLAHGVPVHWGDPKKVGIADLTCPDWGDSVPIEADKIPVFWACGVTPQVALEQARLPICITHKPGHMLITDIAEDAEIPVMSPLPPST